MDGPDILAGCLVFIELFLPTLALYAHFRDRGHTLAEAAAYGAGIPLILLSGIYQLAAVAGRPAWAWLVEIPLVLSAGAILWRKGSLVIGLAKGVLTFGRTHPTAGLSLAVGGIWLGGQAWLGTHLASEPLAHQDMLRVLVQGLSLIHISEPTRPTT